MLVQSMFHFPQNCTEKGFVTEPVVSGQNKYGHFRKVVGGGGAKEARAPSPQNLRGNCPPQNLKRRKEKREEKRKDETKRRKKGKNQKLLCPFHI